MQVIIGHRCTMAIDFTEETITRHDGHDPRIPKNRVKIKATHLENIVWTSRVAQQLVSGGPESTRPGND